MKFLKDAKLAIEIAKILYPSKKIVMMFDHSSVHRKYAENALNVKVMNKKPGGKQPVLRNTIWNGMVQTFSFPMDYPEESLRGIAKAYPKY